MSNMLPQYDTVLFSQIYDNVDDFIDDYKNLNEEFINGIPTTISDTNASTLFYLLYARFCNNPIANYDVTQFKYKLFSIIWQYGPTWEKRLWIQGNLRNLTETDLLKGSKAIYNHAYNPSTAPSSGTLTELQYINEQNTTNYKKSYMDAYSQLWELLDTDVTQEFINRFQKLFKQFVRPEKTWIYVTEVDEDEEDEDDGN